MKKGEKMKKNLEKRAREKQLRKQHKRNELHRYCRLIDSYMERGFFYHEAKKYVRGLMK